MILLILILIFVVTVALMLIFAPDVMSDKTDYKAEVKDLWGIIKLCQTAGFGQPTLQVRPFRRSVEIYLSFPDADRVILTLPLVLKKQQSARADYVELFEKHGLDVEETPETLRVQLHRRDENLGHFITMLYRKIFEATNADIANIKIRTLLSDVRLWPSLSKNKTLKFKPGYEFRAHSTKYQGQSIFRVQAKRILGAAYFLLYPPLMVLSFKAWGLTGMCYAGLIFFGFFAFYNFAEKNDYVSKEMFIPFSLLNGSVLYCILLSTTLMTQNPDFVQSIPSVIGVSTAIISAALAIGFLNPLSNKSTAFKNQKPREFRFINIIWVIGGIGLFLASEWARRHLNLEDWVWFFGLVRIELGIAMSVVFIPAYVVFLKSEKAA